MQLRDLTSFRQLLHVSLRSVTQTYSAGEKKINDCRVVSYVAATMRQKATNLYVKPQVMCYFDIVFSMLACHLVTYIESPNPPLHPPPSPQPLDNPFPKAQRNILCSGTDLLIIVRFLILTT